MTGGVPLAGPAPADGGGGGSPMMPKADPARLAQVEKVLARDSNNVKALVEAGHLYLAERQLDEAARVTIKALKLDPRAAEAHAHLAVLLFAEASTQQDQDSATRALNGGLDEINRALQLKPDLPEAWLFKGMLLMAGKQDMKGAAEAWEHYLKIAPPGSDTTRIHAIVEAAKRRGA
jgi:tetratricopeptide (TPR) repeat protein